MKVAVPGPPRPKNASSGYMHTKAHAFLQPEDLQQTPDPRRPRTKDRLGLGASPKRPESWPRTAEEPTHSTRGKRPSQTHKHSPPSHTQPGRRTLPGLRDALPQRLHIVEAVRTADIVDKHEGVRVLQAPVFRLRPLLGGGRPEFAEALFLLFRIQTFCNRP